MSKTQTTGDFHFHRGRKEALFLKKILDMDEYDVLDVRYLKYIRYRERLRHCFHLIVKLGLC